MTNTDTILTTWKDYRKTHFIVLNGCAHVQIREKSVCGDLQNSRKKGDACETTKHNADGCVFVCTVRRERHAPQYH